MANSAADERLVLGILSERAQNDLVRVWPQLQNLSPEQIKAALADILPELGDKYGDAASSMAADWYENLRESEGVTTRFRSVLAKRTEEAQWRSLIWRVMGPFYTVNKEPNPDDALVIARGGLQRAVANQHRLTIVDSTKADPASKGWRRVGIGENCKFCEMLIDRGKVYRGDTVSFRSHDHCNCAAQPTWSSDVVYVSGMPYEQSKARPRSDELAREKNQRAYDWMDEHLGGH